MRSRLPFDTDRLDRKPVIYDERSWRSTPNIRISRTMDEWLDVISMETANELAEKADGNVLRVFHYNMMSSGEFRNGDFERLVTFVAEFIEFLYIARRINRIDDNLIENISDAVALHSCKQVIDFPELEDICSRVGDTRMMRALDTNVGRYQQLVRDMEDLHSQDQRDIRSGSERGSNFRSQYAGGPGSRDRDSYRSSREVIRNTTAREVGGEYATERKVFVRDDRDSDRDSSRRGMPSSRSYIERQVESPTPGYTFVPRPMRGGTTEGYDRHTGSERNNRMNADNIHRDQPVEVEKPKQEAFPSGRCNQVIPAFQGIFGSIPILKEPSMNIDEHSAVYDLNESSSASLGMRKEMARVLSLAQAIKTQNVSTQEISENVTMEDNIKISDTVEGLAVMVSDHAIESIIETSGENKEGVRRIHHLYGIVDNATVGFRQLNALRTRLSKSSTFKEIITSLRDCREIADRAPPEAAWASDLKAAVIIYDDILTEETNVYFREVLKVSDRAIESVIDDFDDLITQIYNLNNKDLENATLSFFSTLNANLQEANLPKFIVSKSVQESISGSDETESTHKTGYSVLPISYQITHLPFTLKELELDLSESKAITESSGFIRSVLNIPTSDQTPIMENSFRLLITRDRKIIRVYKYPGRDDVFVLSKYR